MTRFGRALGASIVLAMFCCCSLGAAQADEPAAGAPDQQSTQQHDPLADFGIVAFGVPRLFAAASLSFAFASASVPSGDSHPFLLAPGLDASVGYWLTPRFIVGLTSDVGALNQYSAPDATVGNLRGYRWNFVSPLLMFRPVERVFVAADLRFAGTYSLSEQTPGGRSMTYSQPLGFRIRAFHPITEHLFGGAQFEWTHYQRLTVTDLPYLPSDQGISIWQAGLLGGYAF